MHELVITQALLNKVCVLADKNRLKRVINVYVQIGEMSGYVDESIMLYWNIIAKESIASNSQVILKRIPVKIKCLKCGRIMKQELDACDRCKSHKLKIVNGNKLILTKIEGE